MTKMDMTSEANKIRAKDKEFFERFEGIISGLEYLKRETESLESEDMSMLISSTFDIVLVVYTTALKMRAATPLPMAS